MTALEAPPVPDRIDRWKIIALVELAQAPVAAVALWGTTLIAALGALWSERFPFNSGKVFAWSLHSRFSGPAVFRPVQGVVFAFLLLFVSAVAWVLCATAARKGQLSLRIAIAGAFILPTLALIPPAILSEDMASYWSYGRIVTVYHGNPMVDAPDTHPTDASFIPVADVWQAMPSNYGPGFVWVAAAVAEVAGNSFVAAVFLFKLIALLATLAVSLAILRTTRRLTPEQRALRLVLWGWSPIVTLYLVGGGHNDALVALGLAVAGLGIVDRNHKLAFLGILIAGLMKPVALGAAPIYGFWLWRRAENDGDRVAALAGTVLSSLGLVLAYVPYWAGGRALEPLRRIAWRIEDALPIGWIHNFVAHFAGESEAMFITRILSFAALGTGVWWILTRIRSLDALEAIALGFCALLLASTYTQPWYLAWVIVPICMAGPAALERWWRPLAVLAAIWTVKAVANQPRFQTPDAMHLAAFIHTLEGALTLFLVLAVMRVVRRTDEPVFGLVDTTPGRPEAPASIPAAAG